MNTLIALLIVLVIFGVIWYVIDISPLTPPWKVIIKIVVAVILIVYLVTRFLGVDVNTRASLEPTPHGHELVCNLAGCPQKGLKSQTELL